MVGVMAVWLNTFIIVTYTYNAGIYIYIHTHICVYYISVHIITFSFLLDNR